MWAALVLEIFGVIFWLAAFGSMAAWAAAWGIVDSAASRYTSYTSYYVKRAYTSSEVNQQETAWRCVAAAAGLGALIWLVFFFLLSLSIIPVIAV